MAKNKKYSCPECGKKLEVWIDLNASISFELGTNGKLSKRKIEADENGEGRCGVKCTDCDFSLHTHDDNSGIYSDIVSAAFDEFQLLELSLKRAKSV